MDVCGTKDLQRLDELKRVRLSQAIARHKATIIDSFFDTYNLLTTNLFDAYYKQDIDLDPNMSDLNEQEIDAHLAYYRQTLLRYKEVIITFLSAKTLMEKVGHIRRDL